MYNQPLTVPTDIEIINLLSNGKRQTPANVAAHLDHDPRYMSERLRKLKLREYIRDSPPAERSGMYELTNLGKIAAFHIDKYVRDYHNIFHSKCELILDKQPQDEFYPDLISVSDSERVVLYHVDPDGLNLASEIHVEKNTDSIDSRTIVESLYGLFYYGLTERVDGMDVYRLTERGEIAINLFSEDITDPVEVTERLRETYTNGEKKRFEILSERVI